MYLAGYYPTSSPEDVIENTGFEIDVSRAVELEAPEPSVIKLIREEIDPDVYKRQHYGPSCLGHLPKGQGALLAPPFLLLSSVTSEEGYHRAE